MGDGRVAVSGFEGSHGFAACLEIPNRGVDDVGLAVGELDCMVEDLGRYEPTNESKPAPFV